MVKRFLPILQNHTDETNLNSKSTFNLNARAHRPQSKVNQPNYDLTTHRNQVHDHGSKIQPNYHKKPNLRPNNPTIKLILSGPHFPGPRLLTGQRTQTTPQSQPLLSSSDITWIINQPSRQFHPTSHVASYQTRKRKKKTTCIFLIS